MCSTLFVTGMQRSGTTLLARLLAAHPRVSLLIQPFPALYLDAKRRFLEARGVEPGRYPLGPLFGEPPYRPEELADHLDRFRPEPARLLPMFESMSGWSGQGTTIPPAVLESALDHLPVDGGLAALTAHLIDHLVDALEGERAGSVRGSKEIHCEELLPHLLQHGIRCLLILRDPRDIVSSLNHGRGEEYGGLVKPTLFNVRNWRKSVAFGMHLDGDPGFAWLRYEDLVRRPHAELARLATWLGLDSFPAELVASGPPDPTRGRWQGNSSHGEREGVSTASVGGWRRRLPEAAARLIEAACLPELQALGYATGLDAAEARRDLQAFAEPYPDTRQELADYVDGPQRGAEEIERLDRLDDPPGATSRHWFLFEDVHVRLREARDKRAPA
jgi:hypothetical protein